MPSISDLYLALPDRNLPARHVTEYVKNTQDEAFFHLAAAKNARTDRLREHFSRHSVKEIFLSANLSGFGYSQPGCPVSVLEKGFFQEADPQKKARNKALLEGAIVIVNNNDVGLSGGMQHFSDFYNECDKTIFIAWDWDNHHWLDLSTFLAAHSDIYAPSHHENLYLLSRYNWLTCGPVYCATVQWSRQYLTDRLAQMLDVQRSPEPLGKHIPYAPFGFRSRVIATLAQQYSSIGFSDRNFHSRTPDERLMEWASHKLHWIVPVLNDVPIRIFDALCTGGIPIVPESLRFMPPISAIGRNHVLFYTPEDIMRPDGLVKRGCRLFDEGGHDGMVERHRFAIDNHHGDSRVRQMLHYAKEAFGTQMRQGGQND